MTKRTHRVFSVDLKVSLVQRVLGGEAVSALAGEHQFRSNLLYKWLARYRAMGPAGLLRSGGQRRLAVDPSYALEPAGAVAPSSALAQAEQRIAALERTIGRQQVDLDFFRAALRQIRAPRQTSDEPGAGTSILSSKR
jgi:transposase-like protein